MSTTPTQIAELFERADDPQTLWRSDEMRAIWRHQLNADLEFDLGGLSETSAAQLASLATSADSHARTFGDVLFHPTPPLPLLELVKEFAKAHSTHPQSLLPREIAMALYCAAIAAALVRWNRRITSLPDDTLRAGLRQLSRFPWLEENTRALVRAALEIAEA